MHIMTGVSFSNVTVLGCPLVTLSCFRSEEISVSISISMRGSATEERDGGERTGTEAVVEAPSPAGWRQGPGTPPGGVPGPRRHRLGRGLRLAVFSLDTLRTLPMLIRTAELSTWSNMLIVTYVYATNIV